MFNYILRRLLLMIPTLIGMTLMLFVMARFAPGLTGGGAFGDPGLRNARAEERIAAEKAMLRRLKMLDENDQLIPLPKQYLIWLWNACRLDFGTSVKHGVPVRDLMLDRAPVTVSMNLLETLVVYSLAIPGGMLAAVKRGKLFDRTWGLLTIALFSLPVIWTGSLAIAIFANNSVLGWFPAYGIHAPNTTRMNWTQYSWDFLWHLVLPVTVMSIGGFAYLTKLMRAGMIDNLYQDYARTARAKGVSEWRVVTRHVLRNSLLPMITIVALIIPGLLGGSVIIEKLFSIPGMGLLAYEAVFARDLPILQATTFIGSVLTLLFLLVRDILYAIADPRVSYD
jgi:peptide/nickel transport system permease protein